MDICPHCKKEHCVKSNVYRNIENYGNRLFDLPCVHCGEMIRVYGHREVVIDSICGSCKPKSESDF